MEAILVMPHSLMLRPNTEVFISWMFLNLIYRNLKGRPRDGSEGRPQNVGRTCPLESDIRSYRDVLKMSEGDVLKTSGGDVPWCYI